MRQYNRMYRKSIIISAEPHKLEISIRECLISFLGKITLITCWNGGQVIVNSGDISSTLSCSVPLISHISEPWRRIETIYQQALVSWTGWCWKEGLFFFIISLTFTYIFVSTLKNTRSSAMFALRQPTIVPELVTALSWRDLWRHRKRLVSEFTETFLTGRRSSYRFQHWLHE